MWQLLPACLLVCVCVCVCVCVRVCPVDVRRNQWIRVWDAVFFSPLFLTSRHYRSHRPPCLSAAILSGCLAPITLHTPLQYCCQPRHAPQCIRRP